jgi:hypothetical protein
MKIVFIIQFFNYLNDKDHEKINLYSSFCNNRMCNFLF